MELKSVIGITCLVALSGCMVTPTVEPISSYTPDPYPNFIEKVQPEPGESASLSEREDWNLGVGTTIGICVKILESRLLRPGDFIYAWENAELTVDGEQVTMAASHVTEDEQVTLFDETNNRFFR